MSKENFSSWSIADLIFESKLEKTELDPHRKLQIELELKKREKQASERESERAHIKAEKYRKFRTGYQLWGAVFIASVLFVYSILALELYDELAGSIFSIMLLPACLVILGCNCFCFFDAINRRRWGSAIGIVFVWIIMVPYYLLVTTRYD